ncbi:helix-turn-helix domain-containing protein [Lachnospiraceae bacterium 48-21]
MEKYALEHQVTGEEIRQCRKRLGLSQEDFARFANVSKKTVERWEYSKTPISGPIVTLVNILREHPQIEEERKIPEKKTRLRLSYMFRDELCTVIDVDERNRDVEVVNYTRHLLKRAFGKIEKPSYQQYEEFLESRCFPPTRDKMKLVLREYDIPFYDPMMIIERTEGRMAEDDFWIRVER